MHNGFAPRMTNDAIRKATSLRPAVFAAVVALAAAICAPGAMASGGTVTPPPPSSPWRVVNLQPATARDSGGTAGSGALQGGGARVTSYYHAMIWSGSAAFAVDLHPAGLVASSESEVYGMGDGEQVGFISEDLVVYHAGRWNGTAASWVDLHPVGAISSFAYATNAGQQGGYVTDASGNLASLWNGTAASWVNLYPGGNGAVYGIAAGTQIGSFVARVNQFRQKIPHAALWRGTAASMVDLDPAGANVYGSNLTSISSDGAQQVGVAYMGDAADPSTQLSHASLWRGSADSWVDLHPAQWSYSEATGVDDGYQVGFVAALIVPSTTFSDVRRAAIWNGTAASYFDLHSVLPADYAGSWAGAITHDANFIYVTGYGWNGKTKRYNALLWVRARGDVVAPPPTVGSVKLSVKAAGGKGLIASNIGGISCGLVCSASVPSGAPVVLTATPDAGFRFVNWTGACAGTLPICTLSIMVNAQAQANFTK